MILPVFNIDSFSVFDSDSPTFQQCSFQFSTVILPVFDSDPFSVFDSDPFSVFDSVPLPFFDCDLLQLFVFVSFKS